MGKLGKVNRVLGNVGVMVHMFHLMSPEIG